MITRWSAPRVRLRSSAPEQVLKLFRSLIGLLLGYIVIVVCVIAGFKSLSGIVQPKAPSGIQAASVISPATGGHAQTRMPAELAFQRLQSLAGEWEGKDEHGTARTVFQPSVSRTLVMEKLAPSDMSPLMTLYSLDGNGITLVHFCPTNNQPRMKAVPGVGSLTELAFSYIDAGSVPTLDTSFQERLVLLFEDDDHVSETWTWRKNGKDYDKVFHFYRKIRISATSLMSQK